MVLCFSLGILDINTVLNSAAMWSRVYHVCHGNVTHSAANILCPQTFLYGNHVLSTFGSQRKCVFCSWYYLGSSLLFSKLKPGISSSWQAEPFPGLTFYIDILLKEEYEFQKVSQNITWQLVGSDCPIPYGNRPIEVTWNSVWLSAIFLDLGNIYLAQSQIVKFSMT